MKTRSTIQILVPALLFTAATIPVAYSQQPLPDDKKRALHRFDPADIFPEEREPARGRRRRQRNVGPAASSSASGASENPASPSERLRSLVPVASPTPTRRASGATADPSPASTLQPLTRDSAPLSEATPSTTPIPEATRQIDAMAAVQSPKLPSAVASDDQTDSGLRFPLYFIIPMICLILAALVALIIGLKKQLRTP